MTWIVGVRSLLGYAAAISDVQVVFPQGRSLDCLQKIYPVAPFSVAGFAGSVRIGFDLVDDLSKWVNAQRGEDQAINTRIVVQHWWRRARWIFSKQSVALQRQGSQILFAGVSASARDRGSPFPRSDVAVMRSPDFCPLYAEGMQALSIGSGSAVVEYKAALRSLHRIAEADVIQRGGLAFHLASRLSFAIRKFPQPGVSRHLQIAVVTLGDVRLFWVPRSEANPEGQLEDDPTPPVASTWEDFEKLTSQHGLIATAAVA